MREGKNQGIANSRCKFLPGLPVGLNYNKATSPFVFTMNDSLIKMFKSPVLFLYSLFIIGTQAIPGTLHREDILHGLNRTLHATNKLLIFFEQNVDKVNLDAIYGLRVAEGAMKRSLDEHATSFWKAMPETNHIRQQLVEYTKRAGSICNRAQKSIKNQGKFYYNRFKDVVDKTWTFFSDFENRKLPFTVLNVNPKGTLKHKWDEEISDECMSEVLGTNSNHTKCLFSQKCIEALTDKQQTKYGPTHQILFLTLALIKKCDKKYSEILVDHIGFDVQGTIENCCVRVMNEMLAMEEDGVSEDQQDLYMEQGFVCAMHGYEEFLSLKRLVNILSWQEISGCFGNRSSEPDYYDLSEVKMDGFGGDGSSMDKRRRRRNPESYGSMRRLLVELMLENGCSSHESGVGAGLLGLYTKWLLTKLKRSLLAPTKTALITTIHSATTNEKQSGMDCADKDKQMYILAILVSVVTAVLTLFSAFVLYKVYSFCRSDRRGKAYKKLPTTTGDQYLL